MAFCAFPGESPMAFAGDEPCVVAGELGAERLRSSSMRFGPVRPGGGGGVRERLRPRGAAFMADLGALFMVFAAMSTNLWVPETS